MSRPSIRYLTFNVRPFKPDGDREQWNWSVYEGSDGRFLRDGQVHGDRDKAERAARAAIAIMGGAVRETEEDDA